MPDNDPRIGRPSASRMEILCLCPGSEQLRRTLPPEALESGDQYSERGVIIHAAFETGNTFELLPDDLEIYNRAEMSEREAIAQWKSDFGINTYREGPREERYWLHDEATLEPLTSAQLDRHFISVDPPGFILSDDLKSLWCSNLTPAERNYQGRVQAVVAANEYGASHVRMMFNKAMLGTVDCADYDATALWRADFSIRQALWESEQAGAPLRPGDWCIHCPCKASCKAALAYAALPIPSLQVLPTGNGELSKADVATIVNRASIEAVREVFGKRGVINHIMAAVAARLKMLPEDEQYRLELKLNLGRKSDYVRDVKAAFDILVANGFPEDQIWDCLSMSKADVVEMVQRNRVCRESEADVFFEVFLEDCIERGRGDPILAEA